MASTPTPFALPETKYHYTLEQATKDNYANVALLRQMAVKGVSFPAILQGDDQILEIVLKRLLAANYVQAIKGRYYPSASGRKLIQQFEQRYTEYLQVFDLYSGVDAAKGEFAFARYFELAGDKNIWKAFLNQERFKDLRVAVAEFKKANPVDIVFMSFLNEGQFDIDRKGWQASLVLGDYWNEILEACNQNFHADQISDVMEEIIKQGSELMFELLKQEQANREAAAAADAANAQAEQAQEEVVTETVVEEVIEPVDFVVVDPFGYYDPYWDPYYVSPIWVSPLWVVL